MSVCGISENVRMTEDTDFTGLIKRHNQQTHFRVHSGPTRQNTTGSSHISVQLRRATVHTSSCYQALTCSYDGDWYLPVFQLCHHSPLQATKDHDCQGIADSLVLSYALNCPEHFLGTIAVMDGSAISQF